MAKFIYKNFGDDVPRKIEREYNCMLRQEQYQIERDIAHSVGTPNYDPFLHNVADRSLTPEHQAEVTADQLWRDRLSLLPTALDWLRMEYPDEYALIRDYYYADEPITLLYLAKRYGITKQALSKRMSTVRERLRAFITAHENES